MKTVISSQATQPYEHKSQAERPLPAENPPFRACFFVVLRQQWPSPGTGLMSLLLTGGG